MPPDMPPSGPSEDATSDAAAGRGEFELIDRIVARLGRAAASDILVPPGDDAAVWTHDQPTATVATIDTLAEGTHWRPETMSMADVGWRAVATTVSDLAAMGAEPEYLLIAAMLGPRLTDDQLDDFVDGLALSARIHGARVAGGDVVRAEATAFTVTALGRARLAPDGAPLLLRRDAAEVGDHVAVSGTPGAAAAGLEAIEQGKENDPSAITIVHQHRRPRARLKLGELAIAAGLRCAIDISDGLLQDLGHIAKRSNVGIEVEAEQVPLHSSAVWLLGPERALDLALGGGDDYELALTGPPDTLDALAARLEDTPLRRIARVVAEHPGEVVAVGANAKLYQPPSAGWDHRRDAPQS